MENLEKLTRVIKMSAVEGDVVIVNYIPNCCKLPAECYKYNKVQLRNSKAFKMILQNILKDKRSKIGLKINFKDD
jgi:hypothetical protein